MLNIKSASSNKMHQFYDNPNNADTWIPMFPQITESIQNAMNNSSILFIRYILE